jgi:hypothetical protein
MRKLLIVIAVSLVSANAMADSYQQGNIRDDGSFIPLNQKSDRNNTKVESNDYKSGLRDYEPRRTPVDNSYRLDKSFKSTDDRFNYK